MDTLDSRDGGNPGHHPLLTRLVFPRRGDHLKKNSGVILKKPLPRALKDEDTGIIMRRSPMNVLRITKMVLLVSILVYGQEASVYGIAGSEPDYQTASEWWPELNNVWTPIGWKDLSYRFVVLFEGTIISDPAYGCPFPEVQPYRDQGIQISFLPLFDEDKMKVLERGGPYPLTTHTGYRTGRQWWEWEDHPAPVLVTEWRQRTVKETGLRIQQRIFGYIPGATATRTGTEPLCAWIRLSVEEVHPLKHPDECQLLVKINAPHTIFEMFEGGNLQLEPERSRYPRQLELSGSQHEKPSSVSLREENGKVRLAFASGPVRVQKQERPESSQDVILLVRIPAKPGTHADILLPGVPMEQDMASRLLLEGYDNALARADRFWLSGVPDTKSIFVTPEEGINRAIAESLRMSEVIAVKVPSTGNYSLLSGALHYNRLWATPTSMVCHMMLDPLGYHAIVEKYLDIFRKEQGTITPPGPAFVHHPGYYSTPKTLTSIDWLSDHGAILHSVCTHALLTGDEEFTSKWLRSILLGCEFIRDSIRITGHEGVKGIMPPAVPTDDTRLIQAVWSDGWNYKGLVTAVRLLERLGHPRAAEFNQVAKEYRAAFITALRAKTSEIPAWIDPEGRKHAMVPTSLMGDGGDLMHPFYLDTGPLFMVYAGLLEATDELILSTLRFFMEGPNTRFFDPLGHFHQPPVLIHEMASSECCYSWNMPQAHQAGDRQRFLEGMYSLFTGALSRNTYISCETRGGITGNLFANPLAIYMARNAVIDDVVDPGSLHLLRLVPLAWVTSDCWSRFENMATEFGPVDLRFRLSPDKKTLEVQYDHRFRIYPKRVVLHVPPVDGLEAVEVNGKLMASYQGAEFKEVIIP